MEKDHQWNRNDRVNGGFQHTRYQNTERTTPSEFFKEKSFNSQWVISGADESLPAFAEYMGKYMAKNGLTNTKIRNIYNEIKRIQMGEFEKEKSAFYLLKPKVAYALGRDKYNKGLQLFKLLFDEAFGHVSNNTTYKHFCDVIESVLAYHKAHGGKD